MSGSQNESHQKKIKFDGGGYTKNIDRWREENHEALDELLETDPLLKDDMVQHDTGESSSIAAKVTSGTSSSPRAA